MQSLESLETLNLDRNPIVSFRGFPELPSLKTLSLIDCPIADLPNFRALAIACAGAQLSSLNGKDVTSSERGVAEAYARIDTVDDQPVDIGRRLITRGWLPAKHVPVVARKHYILPTKEDAKRRSKKKKGAKDAKEIDTRETVLRWMSSVDRQDHDPTTVRIVRLLRAIGYDKEKIRAFLRTFFTFGNVAHPKQVKKVSAIEQQIAKQQEIIDMLAAQLQALRSGNRTINEYHQLVAEVGVNLLRNAELISSTDADGGATTQKTTNKYDYEKLREAVIAFLEADPEVTDAVLIETLDARGEVSDDEEAEPVQEGEECQGVQRVQAPQQVEDAEDVEAADEVEPTADLEPPQDDEPTDDVEAHQDDEADGDLEAPQDLEPPQDAEATEDVETTDDIVDAEDGEEVEATEDTLSE
jgi:hypothetical protein